MQKLKRIICAFMAFLLMSLSIVTAAAAKPFENNSLSAESIEEYCSLINGCTQSALKYCGDGEETEAVVYAGLDITNPLIVFYVMLFYVTNGVDFNRLTSDPVYSTALVQELDASLKRKGVKNGKSEEFLSEYYDEIKDNLKISCETVGGYTFRAKKEVIEKMLSDDCTDFVIAGSVFMLEQGDLNSDGKKNNKDALIIQNVAAENYSFDSSDEEKFIHYSADINNDGIIDINDATDLQNSIK